MSTREIRNAVITSVALGDTSGRGFLDASITFDYGNGVCQGFGGFTLYLPKTYKHHAIESCAGHFIWRVLEVAGVDKWNALVGKTVRVDASYTQVHGIGHIVNDDWFYPEVDFKKDQDSAEVQP